ncbi:F-box/WD repeat-containing protein 12 isoform X2 [Hemicordylus capensis]|nr:F-box/WD repeat-containing protein 12 isoform X2 [Hemicordylus capensis]
MCLSRWAFCNVSVTPRMQTWKKYYLHRSKLENKMESGRPSADYVCKAMRGHEGPINTMAYLSDSDHMFGTEEVKSVVCTASVDGTVRAWNVQEGTQIWSSPKQEALIVNMITLPHYKLVVTTDSCGMIKLWHGDTGEELAAFSASASSYCSLVAYAVNNKPFLTVGTEEGRLYTLAATDLSQISYTKAFQNCGMNVSLCSPDGQWIVVFPTDYAQSPPKVLYTHCATNPEDDELMLTSPLPVSNQCLVSCWLPTESARIAILQKERLNFHITSFDIVSEKSKYKLNITARQVANFTLPRREQWVPEMIIKGHGKQTILIASGLELKLYSLTGTELKIFQDHHKIITSVWVDPFHVITSSMDLSLRVYSWKNENKSSSLVSLYQLLGGSHRWSSGFRSAACDNVSIVGVVAGTDGRDYLRSYSFNL